MRKAFERGKSLTRQAAELNEISYEVLDDQDFEKIVYNSKKKFLARKFRLFFFHHKVRIPHYFIEDFG